jgi:hypothetical protein
MKRLFLTSTIVLFSLFQNTPAQNKYSVSAGGGYISSSIDQTKLPYWKNGYLVNLSAEYKMSDKLSLFLSSSWQKHLFQENQVNIVLPAVVGISSRGTGENSTVLEFSGGTKFYLTDTRIKPFVGVGLGALYISQGKVGNQIGMHGIYYTPVNIFSDSDKNYLLAQFNLNLGLEFNLINNLSLLVNGQIMFGLIHGPIYFPLTSSLKFAL